MKILLKISFLGTRYNGYQVQKEADTVQGRLCEAAAATFGYPCDITGCSRTDSGVHANEFFVTVTEHGKNYLTTTIPTDKIPLVMNAKLPDDIAVASATEVGEDFHARYDVKYKEYIYLIYAGRERNPFLYGRSCFYPKEITDEQFSRMKAAASYFIGKHDFCAYMAQGSKICDTVRTVSYADVTRDGALITIKIAADGFLYNMVRIIAGTLIGVAEGSISPEEIVSITKGKKRSAAGKTMSPEGLYLNKVVYNNQ